MLSVKKFLALIMVILGPYYVASQGFVYKELKSCENYPGEIFITDSDSIMNLKELPKGLYLIRSISQSLEKPNEGKYFSHQRLVSKDSAQKQFCYDGEPKSSIKVQAFVPTVIDLTKDKKWGNAYWSVLIAANQKMGMMEANRSLIPGEDYREKLREQGFEIEERQKSHHEYELKLQRSVASWKETIVVVYDQF